MLYCGAVERRETQYGVIESRREQRRDVLVSIPDWTAWLPISPLFATVHSVSPFSCSLGLYSTLMDSIRANSNRSTNTRTNTTILLHPLRLHCIG